MNYRPKATDNKRVFGLLGKSLSYSFSKQYFEKKFIDEGIEDCIFDNYEIEKIQDFLPIISNNIYVTGLAVTIPYKKRIIKFLDECDKVVYNTKSCNCVLIKNQKLIGYNTDIIGFEKSFTPLLQAHHKQALILGDGGAAQAIKFILRRLNIHYTIVTRSMHDFSICYQQLNKEIIQTHQIIINTTPLGTFPNIEEQPSIPYEYITNQHYLFDVVYNPASTAFLQQGIQQGATVKNGYEMLCIQAEENWRIWNS